MGCPLTRLCQLCKGRKNNSISNEHVQCPCNLFRAQSVTTHAHYCICSYTYKRFAKICLQHNFSPTMMQSVFAVAFTAVATSLILTFLRRSQISSSLSRIFRLCHVPSTPPGPPRRWLVGSLFDMPKSHPWETFDRWSQLYGASQIVSLLVQFLF